MGQIQSRHRCFVINENDDDRRSAFKNAQKTIGRILREGKTRKQQVMDVLKSPTKPSVEYSLIVSKSASNEMDTTKHLSFTTMESLSTLLIRREHKIRCKRMNDYLLTITKTLNATISSDGRSDAQRRPIRCCSLEKPPMICSLSSLGMSSWR